jgi:serine phosphatase RsbU (regulator of sigma subunit)
MGSNHGELVEYGVENLMRVSQASAAGGPQKLIEAVIQDVDRFCSPIAPHDDCTLIALRYNGDG